MDGLSLPVRAEPASSAALHEREALQQEKDSLRIQAAAVAAQQAALTDEEIKLKQRETALARQEEQLAAHLESKRAQLAALRQQLGEARAQLRRERDEFEDLKRTLLDDVERQRAEASAVRQKAERERLRCIALRRRLKQRWRRAWSVQEAAMRRRELELEAERNRLADAEDRVQQDRADQTQERLRFNAERELGRRQMQDERAEWDREQRNWMERRKAEQAKLRAYFKKVRQHESLLAEVERELLADKLQWEAARIHREKEIEGLECRVRNVRQKLIEQQAAGQHPLSIVESTPAPLAGQPGDEPTAWDQSEQERADLLERLARGLADQRVQLAEQCARLVQAEHSWRQAHTETLTELEVAARRLHERERSMQARERGLHLAETELRQRREDVANGRCQLDAWRAQLAAREAAWESERATLLAQVQAGEEVTKRQLAALDDLRRKWKQRQRHRTDEFQKVQTQFVEARRMYATLWEENLRRSATLDQEKRAAAEKTLALEQYRLQVIGQAENATTAERRLERLRRRWAALFAESERNLARERQALETELGHVETRCRNVESDAADLARREGEQASRQTEWESHQLVVDQANVRLRAEMDSLRLERAQQEQQLAVLRAEVEQMAHTLLEQSETLPRTTSQAA